ncbi:MAG: hypothetical protein V1809_00780 [Planctomycetota bacterium]
MAKDVRVADEKESGGIKRQPHRIAVIISAAAIELEIASDRARAIGFSACISGERGACNVDDIVFREFLCPFEIGVETGMGHEDFMTQLKGAGHQIQ